MIPQHLSTRRELARWEHANMTSAVAWVESRPRRGTALSGRFLRTLHERMFDETWMDAGHYRTVPIGNDVPAWAVPARVEDVVAKARRWIQDASYPPDEIAVRYHHRLTEIRPFEHGNGRVTRLVADAVAMELGRTSFTWGAGLGIPASEVAERYRAALHTADADDIRPLLAFARSRPAG
ncbi:MAG: mobile mystery protein B [Gemmatimonadaceae bacterium]|nr:mobile mystery protein B [Gemmatimonadaceae bacterium]